MAKTMDMEVMAITVSIMEGHTDVTVMMEPVTDMANDLLTIHQQANIHAITIAAEAVDTEHMLTMNNFFMTKC